MPVIGIGIDIVEITRIEHQLAKSAKLAQRILTPAELKDFEESAFPARFLAKRFASKEAIVKAIGTGIGKGIGFQQMEVTHFDSGQPTFNVSGELAQIFINKKVIGKHLSISDEQSYAVANVILES
jgi:holo-[acyl-carrier protein] synthase